MNELRTMVEVLRRIMYERKYGEFTSGEVVAIRVAIQVLEWATKPRESTVVVKRREPLTFGTFSLDDKE